MNTLKYTPDSSPKIIIQPSIKFEKDLQLPQIQTAFTIKALLESITDDDDFPTPPNQAKVPHAVCFNENTPQEFIDLRLAA